ncbi:P-loop NTPase family protein [Streptomyces paludis]|uniref:ATP-binding protein n=1 Tax=Streptomyces paludis TaxID=2282738 RepID=UPI0015F2DBDF|nr:ATP-binding protein [Streptomyces paludis]
MRQRAGGLGQTGSVGRAGGSTPATGVAESTEVAAVTAVAGVAGVAEATGATGVAGVAEATGAPEAGSDALSRTLLTLAVRDYGDGDEEFTEGIDEQLAVVREWWAPDGAAEPFRHIPSPELTERHDVELFLHRSGVRELRGQALVVFITGHGVTGSSNTHFLELPRTDGQRLLATAIRTNEIVTAALDSHADNVLVIVNTCYSAAIDAELASLRKDIRNTRRTGCRIDVIATCDHSSTVLVGRFPRVLRRVLNRFRTSAQITTPWLSVAHLLTEFENELGGHESEHRLRRIIDGSGQTAVTPCLPNPGYRPPVQELVAASLRQVATSAEVVDHWLARASGRPNEQDPGWYFRGRERLNSRIAAFLSDPYGVLLVTGTAGSGKSAVLARAVTLSDPEFRNHPAYKQALELAEPATVPPEKSVTAAVLARHRTTVTLVADLLRGLDIQPEGHGLDEDPISLWSAQLTRHLASPGPPVTLVVDGLDEASDPSGIIRDVLAPLSAFCTPPPGGVPGPRGAQPSQRTRQLRLLIGVRSSRPLDGGGAAAPEDDGPSLLGALRAAFPGALVERTDGDAAEQDIVEYLHALIGPQQCPPETVWEAARTVARLVTPSFLDARLAGEQLRSAPDPLATVADPEWQELLKAGTTGLLRRDLRLVAAEGLPSDVALALLRAAAHAQGAGVPWSNVWPAIAGVFLDRPLENPDDAIEKLLKSRLNGYLAHAQEDDRRVYRPAHEALVATLKERSDAELLAYGESDAPPARGDAPPVRDDAPPARGEAQRIIGDEASGIGDEAS